MRVLIELWWVWPLIMFFSIAYGYMRKWNREVKMITDKDWTENMIIVRTEKGVLSALFCISWVMLVFTVIAYVES